MCQQPAGAATWLAAAQGRRTAGETTFLRPPKFPTSQRLGTAFVFMFSVVTSGSGCSALPKPYTLSLHVLYHHLQ